MSPWEWKGFACLKPLSPKIKIQIPICCPYTFPLKVVTRSCWSISSLCNHLLISHYQSESVLKSIDIKRRILILITPGALRVKEVESRLSDSFCLQCQSCVLIRYWTWEISCKWQNNKKNENKKKICLPSSRSNVANSNNELWKTVWLTSFQKA